jgi:hypothetical protein
MALIFQEFLDSLPQRFQSRTSGKAFGGILQAGESGSPGGSCTISFIKTGWKRLSLSIFRPVPQLRMNRMRRQQSRRSWTMDLPDAIHHPVSGTPKSFSICGDARRTLDTDSVDVAAGLPDCLYLSCNLRERGGGDRRSRKSGRHLGQLYEPCGLKFADGINSISVHRRMQQYLRE